jgi:hypothetical protein
MAKLRSLQLNRRGTFERAGTASPPGSIPLVFNLVYSKKKAKQSEFSIPYRIITNRLPPKHMSQSEAVSEVASETTIRKTKSLPPSL